MTLSANVQVAKAGTAVNPLFLALLALCFFPSVTFGLISAEIFPWAILFALLFTRRLIPGAQSTAVMLFLLALSATFVGIFGNADSDVLRSVSAYFNVILIFYCFLAMPGPQLRLAFKVSDIVFISLLLLGIAQVTGIAAPLQPLLSALVPRGSADLLSELGGRGVTLLSSEPARAGIELTFLYFTYRMTRGAGPRLVLLDLLFLAYVAIVIRSASGLSLAVVVVMAMTVRSWRQVLMWVPLLFLIPLVSPGEFGGRALDLFNRLNFSDGFDVVLQQISRESGHRMAALYSFSLYGLVNVIGAGVGNWPSSSVDALNYANLALYDIPYFRTLSGGMAIPVRGPGVLSNLMLDIGIVGTVYFLHWVFAITRRVRLAGDPMVARIIMLVLLFKITLIGSIGEPLPWMAAAMLLRWNADVVRTPRAVARTGPPPRPGLAVPGRGQPDTMA